MATNSNDNFRPLVTPQSGQSSGGSWRPLNQPKSAVPLPSQPMQGQPPGAESAPFPARPANGGSMIGDLPKAVPNALHDVWSLVKEGTYGTAKKVLHDIPKEAADLVKEQGVLKGAKNYFGSIPGAIKEVASSLVPQSAKEVLNTKAILEDIPDQFHALVKDHNGSYANALLTAIKSVPGGVSDGVMHYANQIDRARQAVINHPVNEFLGYMGLKQLAGEGAALPKTEAPSPQPPKSFGPFKGSYKPEVAKMFETEGIKPPVSAITDNQALRGAEAIASKGFFGETVGNIVKNAVTEIENRTNMIIERITPKKAISDENLGRTIQDGLREFEDKFKVTEGKVYKEFSKTYGESNVYGKATKDALQTLIDEQSHDYFGGVDNRLKTMLDRLTGSKNPEVMELREQVNEFKSKSGGKVPPELERELAKAEAKYDKSLSFNELQATRSSIGERLTREPENTALKRLYGALSKDMQTAVKQIADSDPIGDARLAVAELDKLNQGYATGKAKIEGHIASSISQSNPETIAKNLIKRNSADTLKTVKEMIGESRFAEVQKSFVRNIFKDSVTRGKFDVEKLKRRLADYDENTLNELVTPVQMKEINNAIQQLEKYSTMNQSLKAGQTMAAGSQTAFLSKVGSLGGLLFSGNWGPAMALVFGDYALKALFTTNFGRKLITEGLTRPNFETLRQMKNLSPENKQIIIQSFRQSANTQNGNIER